MILNMLAINWEVISYTSLVLAVFGLIFFLVLVIISSRNMKKQRENARLIHENLKAGDKVMFAAGLIGVITHVEDDIIKVRLNENTIVKADRFSIQQVYKDNK